MRPIFIPALIMIMAALTFVPTLGNHLTNWDDGELITNNPAVKRLSWSNALTIFTSSYVGTYIPLTIVSYALEYHFFGLNARVYHANNLVLHVINVLLVFIFFLLLTQNLFVTAIVTLLFGLHPLHVESIAWATGRKDLLYSFFYLVALISYLYYQKRSSFVFYLGTAVSFLLSLLSKPMAVTLPLVLLLLDYYHQRTMKLKLLLEKMPLFALAVLFLGLNAVAQQTTEHGRFMFPQFIFIACHNFLFYLGKLLWPSRLSAFYPYPGGIQHALPFDFLASPLIVAGIMINLFLLRKKARILTFGALIFAITILPVIQLVPLVGAAIAADRYTYLPSLGFFVIAAAGIEGLRQRLQKIFPAVRIILVIVAVPVIAALSFASWQRSKIWHDNLTLWNDVLHKYPDHPLALNNRGRSFEALKKLDEAMADYNRALALDSSYTVTYFNRGMVYSKKREYDKAVADYDRALAADPNQASIYANRGVVYFQVGRFKEALDDFNQALRLKPDFVDAYNDRGILYFNTNDFEKALKDYNQALALDPGYAMAYANRGDLFFSQGAYARALRDYSESIDLDSTYADAFYNRGVAYARLGQNDKALLDYQRAIKLDPEMANAYNNRGNLYLDRGLYDTAISDYDRAIKLDPAYAGAYYNRAIAYYEKERFDQALSDLLKAQDLGYPVDPEVRSTFQKAAQKKDR